jgi:hypothetical protein
VSIRGGLGLAALAVLGMTTAVGVVWWNGHALGSLPGRESCTAAAAGSQASLDPDQAGNAAVIAVIGVRRGLPARAATIGIATAIQESKLRNLGYGDRDSLGLFQQRPSQGWGTAAQIQDPVYATNAFYDVLVKIEGYQNLPITAAAQKVQRSAFPAAYADHEPEARIFASALSGYSPAALSCQLGPVRDAARQTPGAGGLTSRARAVAEAARAEAGRTASGAASADGTAVRFSLGGADASRLGWSLAQWAVARASALQVVSVETDGQRWNRAGGGRWRPLPGDTAATVPAGTVVVTVAPGG